MMYNLTRIRQRMMKMAANSSVRTEQYNEDEVDEWFVVNVYS